LRKIQDAAGTTENLESFTPRSTGKADVVQRSTLSESPPHEMS
jgi:hypothetical protein